MPKLTVIMRQGHITDIEGESGLSVMEVVRGGGVDEVLATCGGCCSCATCHVYVDPAFVDRLPPVSEDEDQLLDTSQYREATSRLSCQLPFGPELDGMTVTIPPEEWG